ncbi:MAG: peptidoglycan DD-metalloendopeptidase family protein [Clostridia bacterium]|nr:peptidoglycan DD-metalloendopeptidase family protein [Clostridia bacterium]
MEEPKRETNERMERFRLFLRNNGFYIALVACLIVIGGAILLLALTNEPETEAQGKDDTESDPIIIVGQSNDERLNDLHPLPTILPQAPAKTPIPTMIPIVTPQPSATPAPTTKPASAPSKAAPPVQGEIIFGYAVDKLLYSVTLDQWMTHDAVDIAADAGTPVKCVFAGTVERVAKDDALGYTVVVSHANSRTTMYANLSEDIRVKVGDRLNAGDVIGTVGTSAISECAEKPHLHFAVYVDGAPKDPAKYVRLG